MAWRCTGTTNSELIANLKKHGIFHSDRVMKAMNAIDRGNYVLDPSDAYEDAPQSIGHNATISAPHMHAYASEHLLPHLQPGAKVLDIGSGSGYLVGVLHKLVSPGGKVVGVEHIPELVEWSLQNLRKDGHGEAIDRGEIIVMVGDGRLGAPEHGPFDAIHVGAASPGNKVPSVLVKQLAQPGRMFIPVGNLTQYIEQVDKGEGGDVHQERIMGVRYVPLTDPPKPNN
ncbi:hypothetical protein D9619_007681 [Psilocybe cf. subviscida]|uniref:protein-L-isoaspartate(D-aspartate) O-methyltransferase n=1 Tax=Psilocybe cf. subviscida TaxID=2480587 RepID=A0A8H5ATS4_9AGAR|nr:hypothetical protein D9619_007681 [Psilocybe cf. subviscida]